MSFSNNNRNSSDYSYNYDAKLLGILPIGHEYTMEESDPWKIRDIKLCKKPSQQTERGGQVELEGHPNLLNTGVIERRYGMSGLVTRGDDDVDDDEVSEDRDNDASSSGESSDIELSNSTTTNKTSKCTIDGFLARGERWEWEPTDEKNILSSGHPATLFVQSYFDPMRSNMPHFVCERIVQILLATETEPFMVQAKRIRFSPTNVNVPFDSIELSAVGVARSFHGDWTGAYFAKWAVDSTENTDIEPPSALVSAMENISIVGKDDDNTENNSGHSRNNRLIGPGIFHHHYAFVEGKISRKHPLDRSSKTFGLIMVALVGGVWTMEAVPENYTCAHLAEMRAANEGTIGPITTVDKRHDFYKKIRMKRNYWQAHLAGESAYLVGVMDESIPGVDRQAKSVNELRLYDVEKVPEIVQRAAAIGRYKSWTPDELHKKMFDALQLIYDTVMACDKDKDPNKVFTFVKYNEDEPLIYDADGKLQAHFLEESRKVFMCGLPPLSARFCSDDDQDLLLTIVQCVGYSRSSPLPSIKRVSLGDWDGISLELTFESQALATKFVESVRKYWKAKNNIPQGFEKLWIKPIQIINPTKYHHPRPSTGQQGGHQSRLDQLDQGSDRYSHRDDHNYFGRNGRQNNYPQHQQQQQQRKNGRQNRSSISDVDDNWRK